LGTLRCAIHGEARGEYSAIRRRPFQPSIVGAESKEDALEIMRAPRAQWDAR